jgi:hypothetical protein
VEALSNQYDEQPREDKEVSHHGEVPRKVLNIGELYKKAGDEGLKGKGKSWDDWIWKHTCYQEN